MTRPPYLYPDPDRDYMNGAFIGDAEGYLRRWIEAAAQFRQALGPRASFDQSYGPASRHRYDIFQPEAAAQGTVIFIHGGFWLNFDHRHWSHLAAGALARGWAVVMPSYTLAPQARLQAMTAEMAALTRLIAATQPGPLVLSGHSAGGHLAARMACADLDLPVARVVPISPLAELAPLIPTQMNQKLCIDAAEAALESPARLRPNRRSSAHVWCGADERPAFLWQARVLSEEWQCPGSFEAGRHHFDICDGLMQADSALTRTLLDL